MNIRTTISIAMCMALAGMITSQTAAIAVADDFDEFMTARAIRMAAINARFDAQRVIDSQEFDAIRARNVARLDQIHNQFLFNQAVTALQFQPWSYQPWLYQYQPWSIVPYYPRATFTPWYSGPVRSAPTISRQPRPRQREINYLDRYERMYRAR